MKAKNILPNEELIGKRLYAYWNLHDNVWSLSPDGGRVVGYCEGFTMENVELRVRKGGNAQANREGRKNVHAYAVGTVTSIGEAAPEEMDRRISYNPFKGDYFYDKGTDERIDRIERIYGGTKILHA
jgi:hypothetical protein